jgi:hypothetical protein
MSRAVPAVTRQLFASRLEYRADTHVVAGKVVD